MANEFTFTDSDGDEHTGYIEREFYIGDQKWLQVGGVGFLGINWVVPQGWPNNASAICEASEPDAYAEIVATI